MANVLTLKPADNCFILADCKSLDDFYEQLGCECFDITQRLIGGKCFDVFCDDIGFYRDDPVISAVDSNGLPLLVGNLIFANHDQEGNTVSLSDEDVILICTHIAPYVLDSKKYLAVICD